MRNLEVTTCIHSGGLSHSISFHYNKSVHAFMSTGTATDISIFDVTKEEMIKMATELLNIAKTIN